jgi:uncharacterized protein (DUF58 family)
VRSRRSAWLALAVAGVLLLIPFESPIAIALGILLLLAFVVVGVFLVATPEFLEGPRDEKHGSNAS